MCKPKHHMVEEPKPLRSSQRKPTHRSSEEDINAKSPCRSSTESDGGDSLFSEASASPLATFRHPNTDSICLYRCKELADATAQFTSGRIGKSPVWKCVLRGKTVVVTARGQKRKNGDFRLRLRDICITHHASIVKLLGACCEGEQVYLVYEYVQGSSLADCLWGSKATGFTVLGSWISRMQIAIDVAQGLEYMHHDSNINYVHNYVKSSSILVIAPGYRARMCHLGACFLAGGDEFRDAFDKRGDSNSGIQAFRKRSGMKVTGTHGYMAPEYVESGILSPKADVFALGVVLLELLSGRESMRYVQAKDGGGRIKRIGLIETLNTVLSEGGDNLTGRLRMWMDRRLNDSFPVYCAARVARIAASCVDPDPGKRPDTRYVAGELSKVFIVSKHWSERINANKGWISGTIEAR